MTSAIVATRRSRRSFLRIGAAGMFGLALARWLEASAAASDSRQAKSLILLWLGGGPATIDMWDMKPQAPAEIRGEFQPIATSLPGLQICERLPELAKVMDRCALVRSLSHSIPDHGPGGQYVMTGNKPSAAVEYPSLGALAAHAMPDATPPIAPYVVIGQAASSGAGYLGSAFSPFEIAGAGSTSGREFDGASLPAEMTVADLDRRAALRQAFDAGFAAKDDPRAAGLAELQARSVELLRSDRMRTAMDLSGEKPAAIEAYGRGELGRNMLAARRLIEHGARFVTVGATGWDTHQNNFAALRNTLLPPLDRALSALIADLDERGMLDETLVCCLGEFGRTPQVNGDAGRDHWSRAMSALLAGGGVKRGLVHGETDPLGREPVSGLCTPGDLAATLLTLLGVDTRERLITASGRPMAMFAQGAPIRQIMA